MSLTIYNNNALVAAKQESNPVTINLPSAVDLSSVAVAAAASAETSATNSSNSATLSYEWANNPEDVVVSGGEFSSYHWAKKAEAAAASVTGYQPLNSNLTSISSLGTAANKILYSTGVDTWAETDLSAYVRTTILNAVDLAALWVVLGLKTAAAQNFTDNNDLSVDPGNVGTRGNMKAYADAASGWTESPLVPTTSGSVIDFASLPAGIKEIQLLLNGMSYAANTTGLIQLGTGGVPQTTGYQSSASADYGSAFSSTAGFAIRAVGTHGFYGVVDIKRADGNDWVESHSLGISIYPVFGGGGVTLTGELDFLRITSSSSTFDAGSVKLRYR